jgi:transcriptional regulator GlxA family with amidase domain
VPRPMVVRFADGANAFAHALAAQVGAAARTEDPRQADEQALLDLVAGLMGNDSTELSSIHRMAAQTYIDHHLRSPTLSASQIAAAIGISGRHLSRIFAAAGTSLPKWVMTRRLEAAHALLQRPEAASMTIAAIARECGFTSAAHFSTSFTSRFGERARDVRRRAVVATSVLVD